MKEAKRGHGSSELIDFLTLRHLIPPELRDELMRKRAPQRAISPIMRMMASGTGLPTWRAHTPGV